MSAPNREGWWWGCVDGRWTPVRVERRDGGDLLASVEAGVWWEIDRCEWGARIPSPGEPTTPHAIRRALTLIAAYLAPSQPISYGKLVELLREVEGFEGIRYRDIYPILFNSKLDANPFDPDDPLAIHYDPEAAARELLEELRPSERREVDDA